MNTDLYAILGVKKDASPEEIKAAYRDLAVSLHPDKNPRGSTLMQAINEAYETLSDPAKRKVYDRGEKVRPFPKAPEMPKDEHWANVGGTINLVALAANVTPTVMQNEVLPLVSQLLGNVVKDPRAASVKELAGILANGIRPKKRGTRKSA